MQVQTIKEPMLLDNIIVISAIFMFSVKTKDEE